VSTLVFLALYVASGKGAQHIFAGRRAVGATQDRYRLLSGLLLRNEGKKE
jgi:hypothetical protein